MKTLSIILTVLCLAMIGCERIYSVLEPHTEKTPDDHTGQVYLTVDKTTYTPDDTIRVTLHNQADEPVFLEGCSQIYLATKTDTGWSEAPMSICVWEGFAVKINPGSVLQRKHIAKYFRSVHKFVAPVYFGCLDGTPISGAKCNRKDKIYSPEFVVVGYDNAAGNLAILLQKFEYKWTPDDLGSSPQIQATIRNNSDRTYDAMLGDGFNSSLDQETLFVAEGSAGFIERFDPGGAWNAMPRSFLIEGVRFVALRPQKNYRLIASFYHWRGDETGQFRIKIEYFDQIDPPAGNSPHVDYSQIFKILSH